MFIQCWHILLYDCDHVLVVVEGKALFCWIPCFCGWIIHLGSRTLSSLSAPFLLHLSDSTALSLQLNIFSSPLPPTPHSPPLPPTISYVLTVRSSLSPFHIFFPILPLSLLRFPLSEPFSSKFALFLWPTALYTFSPSSCNLHFHHTLFSVSLRLPFILCLPMTISVLHFPIIVSLCRRPSALPWSLSVSLTHRLTVLFYSPARGWLDSTMCRSSPHQKAKRKWKNDISEETRRCRCMWEKKCCRIKGKKEDEEKLHGWTRQRGKDLDWRSTDMFGAESHTDLERTDCTCRVNNC